MDGAGFQSTQLVLPDLADLGVCVRVPRRVPADRSRDVVWSVRSGRATDAGERRRVACTHGVAAAESPPPTSLGARWVCRRYPQLLAELEANAALSAVVNIIGLHYTTDAKDSQSERVAARRCRAWDRFR